MTKSNFSDRQIELQNHEIMNGQIDLEFKIVFYIQQRSNQSAAIVSYPMKQPTFPTV